MVKGGRILREPDGILVVDENREFFTYNQLFVNMWEIPDDVVASGDDQQTIESVLAELEQSNEFLQTVEYFYRRATGEPGSAWQ